MSVSLFVMKSIFASCGAEPKGGDEKSRQQRLGNKLIIPLLGEIKMKKRRAAAR